MWKSARSWSDKMVKSSLSMRLRRSPSNTFTRSIPVTKSFTSVAVGMLVNEGRLSLADRWISNFPEYEGEIADERFRNVTVRNLLTMTMGQESDLSYIGAGDDWAHGGSSS